MHGLVITPLRTACRVNMPREIIIAALIIGSILSILKLRHFIVVQFFTKDSAVININVIVNGKSSTIETDTGFSLLDTLRTNGCTVYAPCGGKGTCGKCNVDLKGEGVILACTYYPEQDIEIYLPGKNEAAILTSQTEFLEDLPLHHAQPNHLGPRPYGAAVDIGTTSVVIYFVDLLNGQIKKVAAFLNPQIIYGADVITRITHCQGRKEGLHELQQTIIRGINAELEIFAKKEKIAPNDLERIIIAGNTTMLHLLLGADPVSIGLAPFKPKFTVRQETTGRAIGLHTHADARIITLPCISAYVGADIVAGLAALKAPGRNYLFLDIGTNGEIALVKGETIYTCAAAAGPAFEGANLTCGMGAGNGAISVFAGESEYSVIGNCEPTGICGSGIFDIVAYLLDNDAVDHTGLLHDTFIIHQKNNVRVTQQDIREIQLAKSAIYSGIRILMNTAEMSYDDIDALYLAGGFGNYINIDSAIRIGLLPHELKGKMFPIGNSAGIGALQYLRSDTFETKIERVLGQAHYIELSYEDDFPMEFALNMGFTHHTSHSG